MKKIYFISFLCFLLFSPFCFSQGMEDFSNASLPTTYSDGNFIGNDGIQWSYVHARNEATYPIDGNGLMLRRADEPSSISATISGGIEDFSVDTRKAFTGNTQRKLELVINGTVVQQFQPPFGSGEDATVIAFTVEDINVEGTFTMELRMFGATGNQQIILDNISWTGHIADDAGCQTPTITSSSGATVCEGESADISVASDGEDIFWFDAAIDGNELSQGENYSTGILEETTSFWAEARNYALGDMETGGAQASTTATTASAVNSASTPWGLSFDAYEDFMLNSVDVYLASSTPGDITVQLKDNTYTLIEEVTVSLPAGNSSSPVQHTIPLNFSIPQGTGYKLVASSSPTLVRQFSSAHPGFPYPIGTVGSVTAGTINNSTSNNTVYYFFYNWSFTPMTYCASDREEVVVNIYENAEIEINATSTTICSGSSTSLSASSSNTDYVYSWSPGDLSGANVDVTPTETTVFTVTATDPNTGCETSENISVTVVDEDSESIVVNTSSMSTCNGMPVSLNAQYQGTNAGVEWTPTTNLYYDEEGTAPYSGGIVGMLYVIADETAELTYTAVFPNGTCGPISEDVTISSTFVELPDAETTQQLDDGSTLADVVITGNNLTWYADANGTTTLTDDTPLQDGDTYYVSQTIGNCESELLAITINFTMSTRHIDFKELNVYPNPTAGALFISNGNPIKNIEVYNLMGQKLATIEANASQHQVNMNDLPGGAYLLKISTANATKVISIIKR